MRRGERRSSLTIGRLNCVYLVPESHPDPEAARWQLDRVAREALPDWCGRIFEEIFAPDDPSLWLIRSLSLDFALEIRAWDEQDCARRWASHLAEALVRLVREGADGENVLWFPDYAAYLAQFAADLAHGDAWNRWQYEAFDSLRSLPTGTALREALLRDPEEGVVALTRLTEQRRLETVVRTLSETDAQRLLEGCFAPQPAPTTLHFRTDLAALLEVWSRANLETRDSELATAQNVLRLTLAARTRGASPAPSLPNSAQNLLGFIELLRRTQAPSRILEALAAGALSQVVAALVSEGVTRSLEVLPSFIPVAQESPEFLRSLASVATSETEISVTMTPDARLLVTPNVGLYLALASWAELGLPEVFEDAFEPERAALFRWLVGLSCLGGARVPVALYDPAVWFALGLDAPPDLDDVRAFTSSFTPELAEATQRRLLAHLMERGYAEGRTIAFDLVEFATEPFLLLRDLEQDLWLWAARAGESVRAALIHALDATQLRPELALIAPPLLEAVPNEFWTPFPARLVWTPQAEGESQIRWLAGEGSLSSERERVLRRFLQRASPASEEGAYFSLLGRTPTLAKESLCDAALVLFARAALQKFARRLSGFDWSRAAYLYANALAGTGTVRITPERIEAQLPAVPLQILLQMAGAQGQTYTLPWLRERAIELTLLEQ